MSRFSAACDPDGDEFLGGVHAQIVRAAQRDVLRLCHFMRTGLKPPLGDKQSPVSTDVGNDRLQGGDPFFGDRPVPELALDYPKKVNTCERPPCRHVNRMHCVVSSGDQVIDGSAKPQFAEKFSRLVLVLLPLFH